MLKITKYYKTIFLGFLQNNFANVENKTVLEQLSTSKDKETFLKNNANKIIVYLQALDADKDGNLSIDPKYNSLLTQIGINHLESQSKISIRKIAEKLAEYTKQKIDIESQTKTLVIDVKKSINIGVILNSPVSLRQGIKGEAVFALQEFLGIKADSDFGKDTKIALEEYQKEIGYTNPDGILTIRKSKSGKYFKTMQSIIDTQGFNPSNISDRTATVDDVISAGEKVDKSIDANIDMLKISKEFFKALEAREDGGARGDIISDMGSILGILREIFGKNNASEYFKKIDIEGKFKGAFDKITNPKTQESFNKGYKFLIKDTSTRNTSLALYGFRDILMVLFAQVPLFDVRLNFAKSLNKSGVDMRRAMIFTTWVQSGMKQSFEDYEKGKGKDINTGENLERDLNSFKATVTSYIISHTNLTNSEINPKVIAELRKTDTKLDELINTYISDRFIPDAETGLAGGFNVFEHFFDPKYDKIKEKIDELNGGEVNTGKKAMKKASSSYKENLPEEKKLNVFLLKNGTDKKGYKFYLHIGTEYKEFDKKPSSEEIKSSILEYNNLSLYTYGPGSGRIWTKKPKKFQDKNISYISKDKRLKIANEIIIEFNKQNTYSEDNKVGAGKLDGYLDHVENRLDYYNTLNKENSKFLKSAIFILEAKKISPDIKQTFGIINYFNTTQDFLNAYGLPKSIDDKIKGLNNSILTPEEYVNKLVALNNDKDVKEAFDAIKGGDKGIKEYKHKINNASIENVPELSRVDAGKFKFGARMLTREEFNMPYSELQAEYKSRFDNKTKDQDFDQEFTGSFKDVYTFNQPSTYDEYLDKLAKTGPNLPDKNGKYLTTVKYWTSKLIDLGIYNITGEDVMKALKDHGHSVPTDTLHGDFINTSRVMGHDSYTTFENLVKKRGDKNMIFTNITREYSFKTKSGDNITRKITYDIQMRPECQNLYMVPNSKSIQNTIISLKQDNAVSILNTPSIPVGLFSLLNNGGNGGLALNGGKTAPGKGGGGGGNALGGGLGVGF